MPPLVSTPIVSISGEVTPLTLSSPPMGIVISTTPAPPACARSPSTSPARRSVSPIGNSPSTSPNRVGSSTTLKRSGRRSSQRSPSWTTSLDQPIAAIGITDQRATVVLWDKRTVPRSRRSSGDRRTAARCEQLESDGHLDLVRSTTGLVLDPYFSGSKFEWLLRGASRTTNTLRSAPSTHGWSGSSRAGCTSPAHQRQSHALVRHPEHAVERRDVRLFNVPMSALPEVRPSSGRFGVTTADLPIPSGVPVRVSPATSRLRSSAKPALRLVKRRTPTAPAPSCS